MYDKILVPLDGSELAEAALPYAEELAGRLGSEVTLMYVSDTTEHEHYHVYQLHTEKMAELTKRGAERYLEKTEGKVIKVEPVILIGNPAEEIVDYADKEGINLIIIATHGRSGIRRWVLGSVADKVVRAAKQPVALIRAKGARTDMREKDILDKILVPLDGSKESEAVIPYIEDLASRLKAEVTLFHAIAQAHHVYVAEQGVSQVAYSDEEMEPLKARATGYLEKVARKMKDKGITTRFEVRIGAAAEEIINLADETHSDVVAMSTCGHSGASRWAFGSVTDKVLHAGNTPVLLVRVPGAAIQ